MLRMNEATRVLDCAMPLHLDLRPVCLTDVR